MNRSQNIKLYLFVFFLISTVAFAILFPRLTLPFGFAYIIYLMARPILQKLIVGNKRQRIFYLVLLLLIISFSFFPLFASLNNADTDFSEFSKHFPEIEQILQTKFSHVRDFAYAKFKLKLNVDPIAFIMSKLDSEGSKLLGKFPDLLSSVFEWILLVPMFLYFFFVESRKFNAKFIEIIPNSIFEKAYVLFSQFNTKFGEYIIAKVIEATLLGTMVTAGLFISGFPYPFILGFIAGVTNILPYIGPIIGFAPAFLVALLSKDPNASMIGMVIIYSVANLIDMVLIFPLLVSKIVNLHPIVVVVSIILGSQLGGIIGMIIIIPFVAFFKLLYVEIYKDLSIQ